MSHRELTLDDSKSFYKIKNTGIKELELIGQNPNSLKDMNSSIYERKSNVAF